MKESNVETVKVKYEKTRGSDSYLAQNHIFMKGCRLSIADYKVEALSRKKGCISAVQTCKQASVRNLMWSRSVSFVVFQHIWYSTSHGNFSLKGWPPPTGPFLKSDIDIHTHSWLVISSLQKPVCVRAALEGFVRTCCCCHCHTAVVKVATIPPRKSPLSPKCCISRNWSRVFVQNDRSVFLSICFQDLCHTEVGQVATIYTPKTPLSLFCKYSRVW